MLTSHNFKLRHSYVEHKLSWRNLNHVPFSLLKADKREKVAQFSKNDLSAHSFSNKLLPQTTLETIIKAHVSISREHKPQVIISYSLILTVYSQVKFLNAIEVWEPK